MDDVAKQAGYEVVVCLPVAQRWIQELERWGQEVHTAHFTGEIGRKTDHKACEREAGNSGIKFT